MQNDPLSHGLWELTAPPAPPTSALKGEVRADVAVVGCRYTGLSTALHLAEAGAKVVALEAIEIGFGGAGRNVGLVNAGMWLPPARIHERRGARRSGFSPRPRPPSALASTSTRARCSTCAPGSSSRSPTRAASRAPRSPPPR